MDMNPTEFYLTLLLLAMILGMVALLNAYLKLSMKHDRVLHEDIPELRQQIVQKMKENNELRMRIGDWE